MAEHDQIRCHEHCRCDHPQDSHAQNSHNQDSHNDNGVGQDDGGIEGRVALKADEAPVLIEVTRGGVMESQHRGQAIIVDADGHVVAHWGDCGKSVFPRSAVKALQAVPLVESGALDAFGLSDAELALACASHNGESRHTRLVGAWLHKVGLGVKDLECGAHPPNDPETAHEMIRLGEPPTALHNNCSGKHAGMLTTAKFKGEPTRGYVGFDHPVQQRILGVLEQMTCCDLSSAPRGIDGCSIPTIAIPLAGVALAMAHIADPKHLPGHRAEAVTRIRNAWAAHPYLIAGRDAFDTRIMHAAAPGRVLVKSGAEGVCCAVLPKLGLGIALKIEDGSPRAAQTAMATLLGYCRERFDERLLDVTGILTQPLKSRTGLEVGAVRPVAGWPK